MGILDDAIREHLDLKRRLGAEEDELQRLEGEAFGPPTRPGDPDFPDTDTGAQALVDDAPGPDTSSELVAEPPSEELAPRRPRPPRSLAAPAEERRHRGAVRPVRGRARPRPGPRPRRAPGERGGRRRGPAGRRAAGSGRAGARGSAGEPEPPATARAALGEPPIESLDTVEHPFEGAVDDTGEAELVEGELEEGQPATGEHEEEEDEDVLEETPEFLRDAPEDDELWFEQGEPKDFDF